MSTPELQQTAPSFIPSTDDPLQDLDAVTALQNALEARPTELDFIVAPDSSVGAPVGRSWAFDHKGDGFIKSPGALSPLPTSDQETLRNWIEKCLRTARGAHPIHPPGYGLVQTSNDLIGVPLGQVPSDLFGRIEDALTFHPRISGCEDFQVDFDPDDEAIFIDFVVRLDDDSELSVNRLGVSL
jgi:hypothetical protein